MRVLVGLGCLMSLFCAVVGATTVRAVSLSEMLAKAELVFQGRVVYEKVKGTASRPYTQVTFKITELIKGDHEGDTITLDFAGAPNSGVMVGDMHYPHVGEEGIYFIESLTRRQANPLYGWSQGHFRIHRDQEGRQFITSADDQPVVELDLGEGTPEMQISQGIAKGVRVRQEANRRALSPEEFKFELRRKLGQVE